MTQNIQFSSEETSESFTEVFALGIAIGSSVLVLESPSTPLPDLSIHRRRCTQLHSLAITIVSHFNLSTQLSVAFFDEATRDFKLWNQRFVTLSFCSILGVTFTVLSAINGRRSCFGADAIVNASPMVREAMATGTDISVIGHALQELLDLNQRQQLIQELVSFEIDQRCLERNSKSRRAAKIENALVHACVHG